MNDQPTFASVTNIPCTCGMLEQAADDPAGPIVFDPPTGEFHLQYREAGAFTPSTMILYHCFFCGGAAPKSKRDSLYYDIPRVEESRLTEMFEGVTSIEEAARRFGPPDEDLPQGMIVQSPARDGMPPTTCVFRIVRYTALSKVANVSVQESPGGKADWCLQAKGKLNPHS